MPSFTDSADPDLRRVRQLHRALGDETRLRILALLAQLGPMPVNALSLRVGLSQPLISWHLRILRLAGFIDTERHGREVICTLRRTAFDELALLQARVLSGEVGLGLDGAGAGETAPGVADVG
jgi:DNA-binding transcriptional ArsR family regulator